MSKVLIPKESAEDPRLAPIVHAAMKKAGLASSWESTVVQLATGQLSAGSMRCCGSGCRPCVQDVQRCVVRVIKAWSDPRFEQQLLASADLSIKGRSKRIARRLIRKIGG